MIDRIFYESNRYQRVIYLMTFTLFLPFYMATIGHLIILLFEHKNVYKAYQKVKGSGYALAFCILSSVVSLLYSNWIGFFTSFAIFVILSDCIYIKSYCNKECFFNVIKLFLIMSVFCAFYGLIEYVGILDKLGYDSFQIIIFDKPKHRINSVFQNANFYSTMIEFFVLMAFYMIIHTKKHILTYSSIIAINLFMLYLSGSRTAWAAMIFGIFAMMVFLKGGRVIIIVMLIAFIIFYFCDLNFNLFPRFDSIGENLDKRIEIWMKGIEYIKLHPLFGQGPFTFMLNNTVLGKSTPPHAHNLYIEPFVSQGIVGVLTLAPFIFYRIKEMRTSIFKTLFVGIVAATLVHGILDCTIYFFATCFTLLMIFSASFEDSQIDNYQDHKLFKLFIK